MKRQCINSVAANGDDNHEGTQDGDNDFLLPMTGARAGKPVYFKFNCSLFGEYCDDDTDALAFNTPSHLLSDFSEIWASTGGIELETPTNGCRWNFDEGMLFGSMVK